MPDDCARGTVLLRNGIDARRCRAGLDTLIWPLLSSICALPQRRRCKTR
jgi:hypothetical protein